MTTIPCTTHKPCNECIKNGFVDYEPEYEEFYIEEHKPIRELSKNTSLFLAHLSPPAWFRTKGHHIEKPYCRCSLITVCVDCLKGLENECNCGNAPNIIGCYSHINDTTNLKEFNNVFISRCLKCRLNFLKQIVKQIGNYHITIKKYLNNVGLNNDINCIILNFVPIATKFFLN